jgi:hypothetical protein
MSGSAQLYLNSRSEQSQCLVRSILVAEPSWTADGPHRTRIAEEMEKQRASQACDTLGGVRGRWLDGWMYVVDAGRGVGCDCDVRDRVQESSKNKALAS